MDLKDVENEINIIHQNVQELGEVVQHQIQESEKRHIDADYYGR
jgi:hypothetical protein